MYLKNISGRSVVINTTIGKLGIKPGEVIDLKYKVLPPMSTSLKEVSEEEFISFCKKRDGIVEEVKKVVESEVTEPESVVPEQKVEENIEVQDPSVMDFVNQLINPEPDKEQEEALKVVETQPDDQITKLEQQIEDLRVVWSTTNSPRRKEKIGKEIKELQKQLKKIKK